MKIHRNANKDLVRQVLIKKISNCAKKNKSVLFLASGGSTASIAVDVLKNLTQENLEHPDGVKDFLLFSLIDERFGSLGHEDSNWKLLESLNLDTIQVKKFPILTSTTDSEKDLEQATKAFNNFLEDAIKKRDNEQLYIIGLFGIGSDGHTAGILPDSPAAVAEEEQIAIAYKTEIYTRITISPAFFKHIDFAACWASGLEKLKPLQLLKTDMPPQIQPAQYLKQCVEFELFTDLKDI